MNKITYLSILVILLSSFSIVANSNQVKNLDIDIPSNTENGKEKSLFEINLLPTPTPIPLPNAKALQNSGYHIFQTFNNCGPASLSMALSFYGINVTQKVLGDDLRPYQIASGDNDDKSVTLAELAEKSKEYGFTPVHRPNGDIEIIKSFIASDIPVIVRTWTKPNEDIGHFRVVKGYDESRQILIQDDSLQGKSLEYTYEEFDVIWKKFNYEYLVLVPSEKMETARLIVGEDLNEELAWEKAVKNAREELVLDPSDITSRFNLSVALYNTGNYQEAVNEFEKVEARLPFRTLWYQIEPILAYYELGNYDRVFSITDKVLNGGNRAYSEVYIIRGNVYKNIGDTIKAKTEYEKAVYYNKNLKIAQELLNSL